MQKGRGRRPFSYAFCYSEICIHGQNCPLRKMTLSVLKHFRGLLLVLKSAELPQNSVSPPFSFGSDDVGSSRVMFLNQSLLAQVPPHCLLDVVLQPLSLRPST